MPFMVPAPVRSHKGIEVYFVCWSFYDGQKREKLILNLYENAKSQYNFEKYRGESLGSYTPDFKTFYIVTIINTLRQHQNIRDSDQQSRIESSDTYDL